jgi:hypothetical protein
MPKRINARRTELVLAMLQAGSTVREILTEVGTSYGFISRQRASLGISQRVRDLKLARPETLSEAISAGPDTLEVAGVLDPPGVRPFSPPTYTPSEYFQAIADGLRDRNADNNTLNADNNALRADNSTLGQELVRLEAANRKLLSDLNQCKLQMANWSGPIRLPGRSLGNGG